MENNKSIKFYSCKSYKNGKYLFNMYKPSEFIFILGTIFTVVIIMMINTEHFKTLFVFGATIIGAVIFITFPIKRYHSIYMLFIYFLKYLKSKKVFIWKGVNYVFEKEN